MGFSQMLHTGANFLEGREPTLEALRLGPQKLAAGAGAALARLPELFRTRCHVTAPAATATNASFFLAGAEGEAGVIRPGFPGYN